MKSVLVTGGAGYIGSHTAKALAAAGYQPVTFDNLSTGHRSAVQWGPFIEGDLADTALLAKVFRTYRIEAVLHFAANAEVAESMVRPQKYFRNNVVHSLNLLEAMREAQVRQLVFSSTCAIYGIPKRVPIIETQHPAPANPYGESKLFVERALHWFGLSHGFRFVALRYFNAAGADPDGDIGEDHDPETHLIPLTIQAALGLIPALEIRGTDYPTPDGTAVRDYIHVADLAAAHVLALRYLLAGGNSSAFNLGTGTGRSVKEVVDSVERVGGRRVPVVLSDRRPGDPPILFAKTAKARRTLAWKPQFTDLDTIVRTAWNWQVTRAASRKRRSAVAAV